MRKSPINIMFVDIDETILSHKNGKNKFDKKSLKYLRLAQEKYGVKVVFATGRPYDSALCTGVFNYVNPDAVVSCNGATVCSKGKVIYSDSFTPEQTKQVIEACNSLGLVVEVATPMERFFTLPRNEYVDGYFKVIQETVPEIRSDFDGEDVNALLVFSPKEMDKKLFLKLDKEITGFRFAEFGLDMRTHVFTKANGLKVCLDYFGCNKEQALCIGDSVNGDGPMFDVCKYSVAIGNAKDELKEKAYFVTKSVYKHGLKYAMKKLNIV